LPGCLRPYRRGFSSRSRIAVGDLVMWVDVARDEDQSLHRFRLQTFDVERPRFG
jgi:hypothetical protein